MGKNKEKITGENFKKSMKKSGKGGTGKRSDVEDDMSREKLNRSPNKNSSLSDSMNSGNSDFFLEKLSEDKKKGRRRRWFIN